MLDQGLKNVRKDQVKCIDCVQRRHPGSDLLGQETKSGFPIGDLLVH